MCVDSTYFPYFVSSVLEIPKKTGWRTEIPWQIIGFPPPTPPPHDNSYDVYDDYNDYDNYDIYDNYDVYDNYDNYDNYDI